MKKVKKVERIIGGKVYDTETATMIGSDYNNCEALFKTKNKEWFLVYWRNQAGKDLLVVKSESEARDWCKQMNINKARLINLGRKMKRVKSGKVYDTETATMIGSKEMGLHTDSIYGLEELYKTKNGAWFIYALGKGISYFSTDNADQKDVERIVVMDECDALAWCELSGIDADLIAAHFEITEA